MKKFILLQTLLFYTAAAASAHIDIVYPKESVYKTGAASVFFIGNTDENAVFTINSQKVKLWSGGIFVHNIPVNKGENIIKMVSSKDGMDEELIYTVIRPECAAKSKIEKYQPKNGKFALYAETIKNYSPVRLKPSNSAERLADLSSGAGFYISGRLGDFYKIDETDDKGTSFWIHKSNTGALTKLPERGYPSVKRINRHSDRHYNYIEFTLSAPAIYSIKQEGNGIELTIFGAGGKSSPDKNYKYVFKQLRPLLGYEAYYKGHKLILKIAKTPKLHSGGKPLKNIPVFIDPGHGGDENGAIGPSRVCEKDINLAVGRYLAAYLKEEGADVKLSRTDDRKTGLYDRADAAKNHNALISVSIHANALADGKDPYKQHGAEVHYYNPNAELLAQIIQKDLAENLNFKDNGIHKSSFVLTRSSNPVSVLVECAYMIYPEEYLQLIKPEIQQKIARSIAESIKKYFKAVQK